MGKKNRNRISRRKAAAMAAVLAAPGFACTAGWNSLEASLSHEGAVRNIAINNIAQEVGNVEVGYHGFNDITNGDGSTYYGNNKIWLGRKGGKIKAIVRVLTDENGITRTLVGTRLPKLFWDYGYIDVSTDKDGANITVFSGKKLGEKSTLDFLHSQNFDFQGKPSGYSELQYSRRIGRHWESLVRVEVPNYDIKKARALIGFRCRK